ncbi:sensor histidine kinase [Allosphingosinicella indica]|uniref:histidine kinase n=1 Tax=Allosphingosinicella indica TaxID=941907 RepID=A0A1X7G933_9SPHN|nr:ATP-binding protein [Allosphingosinicella indica]SMF66070.1 Signal transduction histidine kinase, nitrogen specific [Allosphingosinicella indica]
MNFRRRFLSGLAWRVGLLVAAVYGLVWTFGTEGLGAARLVAGMLTLGAVAGLWRYIQRTNVELARFVDAVRFGDLSQGFSHRHEGSGFGEIGEALEDAMTKLRAERNRLTDASRFYESVLDDAPTPLITIDEEGRVELANKAARRLMVRHSGVRVADFQIYGDAFAKSLTELPVGRARLLPVMLESLPQSAMVTAASVHRLGGQVRVIAMQPIQGELNAVELAAQSDLVRVLTHEIMNSMTPVTSLAQTAAKLMADAEKGDARAVADARMAIDTLARRADGVMHFVESYRQISRTPEIRVQTFAAEPWAAELVRIACAADADGKVDFQLDVTPDDLPVELDPDLMSQVLINLMKNGAEAASGHSDKPVVRLSFSLTNRGRIQIEVGDNGPGVPESIRKDVFLPFFTTKAKGTGVGLSLARQIVLAHRGSIALTESAEGGAAFRILI